MITPRNPSLPSYLPPYTSTPYLLILPSSQFLLHFSIYTSSSHLYIITLLPTIHLLSRYCKILLSRHQLSPTLPPLIPPVIPHIIPPIIPFHLLFLLQILLLIFLLLFLLQILLLIFLLLFLLPILLLIFLLLFLLLFLL